MHKINPDDLDAIFKEGADKYEFTYNDAAWADMSQKLDQRDNKNKKRWLLFTLLAIFALAIATWTYFKNDIKQQPLSNSSSVIVEAKTENTSLTTENSDKELNTTNKTTVNKATSEISENKTINKTVVANQEVKNENFISRSTNAVSDIKTEIKNDKTSNTSSKSITQTINNTVSLYDTNEIANNTASTNYQNTDEVLIQNTNTQKADPSLASILEDQSREQVQLSSLSSGINTLSIENKTIVAPNFADVNLSPLTFSSSSKYFFSVHAATEWASVGFLKEPSMGWKAGLGAGIALSKYVELSTGIGVSRKVYASHGEEYEMQGGWVENVMPESLESKCYILDIPINATYYVNGRNENGFFFSGGVSSYIISSEWYGFNYSQADIEQLSIQGIEPQDEVFEQNESHHYVGVTNLSVGMQKRMKNGLFVQIAPYVQIPLTGIGTGKVDLYSTGFKFAVKLNK